MSQAIKLHLSWFLQETVNHSSNSSELFLVNEFNHYRHLRGKAAPCLSKTTCPKTHSDAYVIAGSVSRKGREKLAGLTLHSEGSEVEAKDGISEAERVGQGELEGEQPPGVSPWPVQGQHAQLSSLGHLLLS